jgi:hypothetical protein
MVLHLVKHYVANHWLADGYHHNRDNQIILSMTSTQCTGIGRKQPRPFIIYELEKRTEEANERCKPHNYKVLQTKTANSLVFNLLHQRKSGPING